MKLIGEKIKIGIKKTIVGHTRYYLDSDVRSLISVIDKELQS